MDIQRLLYMAPPSAADTGSPPTTKRLKLQSQSQPKPRTLGVQEPVRSPKEPGMECCSNESSASSSKSTPEPLDLDPVAISIDCPTAFFTALKQNISAPLTIYGVRFIDKDLPKVHKDSNKGKDQLVGVPITTSGDHENICKKAIDMIHEKYVEPLLAVTGYRWVRKEIPSRGKGLKVLVVKYSCSQEIPLRRRKGGGQYGMDYVTSTEPEAAGAGAGVIVLPGKHQRGRQLSHPLKQFECNSHYCIKYTWQSQEIDISYTHCNHAPYKRLPDKLKPFIIERLDMKAQDLYDEILETPEFEDIRELIHFSKVQSFWLKERNRRREESTKMAFKTFLSR